MHAIADTASLADFRTEVLGMLRSLVPFDACVWLLGNHENGQISSVLTQGVSASLVETLAEMRESLPGWQASLSNPDQVYDPADHLSDTQFYKTPFYLKGLARYGLQRLIRYVHLPPGRQQVGTLITLYRSDRKNRFSERDKASLQWLAMHLVRSHERVVWRVLRQRARAGTDSGLADGHGNLLACGKHFLEAVQDAFGKSQLEPAQVMQLRAGQILQVGEWVFTARPVEDMIWILVRARSRLDVLSGQEMQVARLVGEGMTMKEVARELLLSPGTVSAYLHRIYKKVGVKGKAHLIKQVRNLHGEL